MRPAPGLVLAVAAGGAAGAVLRHLLSTWAPDGGGFPTTTFAINVVGSLLLAALPALAVVRRSPALTAGLGPGVLGGFTTLSTYSEETRALLADGDTLVAGLYVVGTLAAALTAVALVSWRIQPAERDDVAREEGDE